MTRRRKSYWKDWEREVARRFRTIGFPEAKRHLEFQIEEAMGWDLDGTEPFAVQIKVSVNAPSITAIEEPKAAGRRLCPIAILKRLRGRGKRKLEVAVLPFEAFLQLVKYVKDSPGWDKWIQWVSKSEDTFHVESERR